MAVEFLEMGLSDRPSGRVSAPAMVSGSSPAFMPFTVSATTWRIASR